MRLSINGQNSAKYIMACQQYFKYANIFHAIKVLDYVLFTDFHLSLGENFMKYYVKITKVGALFADWSLTFQLITLKNKSL